MLGNNGTIDGQGRIWWDLWWNRTLNHTRGHLIELVDSTNIMISNITLRNSPFWTVHPVYCRSVCYVCTANKQLHLPSWYSLYWNHIKWTCCFFFFQKRGDKELNCTSSLECSKHWWHWSRYMLLEGVPLLRNVNSNSGPSLIAVLHMIKEVVLFVCSLEADVVRYCFIAIFSTTNLN